MNPVVFLKNNLLLQKQLQIIYLTLKIYIDEKSKENNANCHFRYSGICI